MQNLKSQIKKYQFTLSQQIIFLSVFILVLYSSTNVVSFLQFRSVNLSVTELSDIWLPNVVRAGELKNDLANLRLSQYETLSTHKDQIKKALEDLDTLRGNLTIYSKTLGEGINSKEFTEQYDKYNSSLDKYFELTDKFVKYVETDQKDQALKLLDSEMNSVFDQTSIILKQLSDIAFNSSQATKKTMLEETETKKLMIIYIALGVLFVGMLTSFLFSRYIGSKLKLIASNLSKGTNTIQESSHSLAQLAHSVTSAATEQSSAVQETISSLKEMDNMISTTTQSIKTFSEKAKNAKQQSVEGKNIVDQLIVNMNSMEDTNNQLYEISKVIEHIDEQTQAIHAIVFKTQLLSFNASIEAARAGQNGRGFAVVAEEVGQLSLSSGKAARDIESLIANSQVKVKTVIEMIQNRTKENCQISYQTLENFNKISQDIEDINLQMETITDASYKQEVAIKQSYSAMKELDKAALLNTSSSAQVLRMSGDMKTESDQLQNETTNLLSVVTTSDKSA